MICVVSVRHRVIYPRTTRRWFTYFRHMLRQTGLELFMAGDGGSAFFNFESSKERDEVRKLNMS